MWNSKKSVVLSIVVCFVIGVFLTLGLFLGPWVASLWLHLYRNWNPESINKILTVFCACYYPCAIFAYLALYSLLKLLFNIKNGKIFIMQNIKYLRHISYSCFAAALITLIGGIFYLPFGFISIAAAFIGLMLRIVKNVMHYALEIKTENELTI